MLCTLYLYIYIFAYLCIFYLFTCLFAYLSICVFQYSDFFIIIIFFCLKSTISTHLRWATNGTKALYDDAFPSLVCRFCEEFMFSLLGKCCHGTMSFMNTFAEISIKVRQEWDPEGWQGCKAITWYYYKSNFIHGIILRGINRKIDCAPVNYLIRFKGMQIQDKEYLLSENDGLASVKVLKV